MIVIVGSRELWPTPALASKILSIMVSTEDDIAIRARIPHQVTSGTEELAERIGERIGRRIVHFETSAFGSNAGFLRDVRMVKASVAVYAFMGAEATATDSGTGHVIDVALRAQVPVWAFGLDRDGSIIEIGGDDAFVDTIPQQEDFGGFTWQHR